MASAVNISRSQFLVGDIKTLETLSPTAVSSSVPHGIRHVDQVPETHLPDMTHTFVSVCGRSANVSLNSDVRVGSSVTLGHFLDKQPRHASADPQRLRQTALPRHPSA